MFTISRVIDYEWIFKNLFSTFSQWWLLLNWTLHSNVIGSRTREKSWPRIKPWTLSFKMSLSKTVSNLSNIVFPKWIIWTCYLCFSEMRSLINFLTKIMWFVICYYLSPYNTIQKCILLHSVNVLFTYTLYIIVTYMHEFIYMHIFYERHILWRKK